MSDTPTDAANQAAGKTFTQDELNKIVGDKSQRLKEAHERTMVDEVAKASTAAVDAYKKSIASAAAKAAKDTARAAKDTADATNSNITELEGNLARLTKERDTAVETSERHLTSIKRIRVDDVVLKAAHKMRFIDPTDSIRYISGKVQYDPVKDAIFVLDDKGKPSGETVEELLTTLAAEKEYLIQPTGQGGAGSNIQVGTGNSAGGEVDKTSPQWIGEALRKGLFSQ